MSIYTTLHFLAFVALAAAGIVPVLVALRVRITSFQVLSSLLGLFAISHGLYHLASAYGGELLADVILNPIAVVSLIWFGLYYSKKAIV